MPGITPHNVGTLTPDDLAGALSLFEALYEEAD